MAKLGPLLRERESELEVPRRERLAARPTLKELFAGAKDKQERDVRIYDAVIERGYQLTEVGENLGLLFHGEPQRRPTKVKSKELSSS